MNHKLFPWLCRKCRGVGLEPLRPPVNGHDYAPYPCSWCGGGRIEWRTVFDVLEDHEKARPAYIAAREKETA